MYITGMFVYIFSARNCDGVNLLECEKKFVKTERGLLNVEGSLFNLTLLSVFSGLLFPITWVFGVLYVLVNVFEWMVTPISKFLINKFGKEDAE